MCGNGQTCAAGVCVCQGSNETWTTGREPTGIAAADMNKDGRLDLPTSGFYGISTVINTSPFK